MRYVSAERAIAAAGAAFAFSDEDTRHVTPSQAAVGRFRARLLKLLLVMGLVVA
jgi:hypothetical protein